MIRGEGHRHVEGLLVLGEGDEVQGLDAVAGETAELFEHQGAHQLTHPVGAEVETDQAIAGAQMPGAEAVGLKELIVGAGVVGRQDHLLS